MVSEYYISSTDEGVVWLRVLGRKVKRAINTTNNSQRGSRSRAAAPAARVRVQKYVVASITVPSDGTVPYKKAMAEARWSIDRKSICLESGFPLRRGLTWFHLWEVSGMVQKRLTLS